MTEAIIFVVFPFCMVFAAISDVMSMKISNLVPLVLLGSFVCVAPLTGMAPADFGMHIAAGLAVLGVTFGLFAFGAMGGGDAKLMAATAVWMGLGPSLLTYLLVAAVFGGQLTLAILMFRKSPYHDLAYYSGFLRNFAADVKGVPYGIALGAGGLFAYANSPLVSWALTHLAG